MIACVSNAVARSACSMARMHRVHANTSQAIRAMTAAPYRTVSTPDAPQAIGPYSQCVVYNGTAYVSGCIPFDPKTMTLVEGGIEAQAERALQSLKNIVTAAGSDVSHILKVTVFLKDMNDFAAINGVYEKAFAPYKPARSAVEVARLPRDVCVEFECIAAVK